MCFMSDYTWVGFCDPHIDGWTVEVWKPTNHLPQAHNMSWNTQGQMNVELFDLLPMWPSNIADTDKEYTGSVEEE